MKTKAIINKMITQYSMPGVFLLLAFFVISLTDCAPSSASTFQTSSEKLSEDHSESPYFIVMSDEEGVDNLPLKSTSAEVNIAGVIADVTVKQVYTNAGQKTLEAIYVFPASTNAAVYKMKMKINDREIEAIVREKAEARQMYETAKEEGKAASLLEQHKPNVFQMNVANIIPGATVEVELSYTELLVPVDGTYEFVYPTVVGPRYSHKAEEETEDWVKNPYLEEGAKPNYSFDIKLNVEAGIPIQYMNTPSHQTKIQYKSKKSATVELEDVESQSGNKDFILHYKLKGSNIETGVLVYEDNGEKYFLAMMQPPKRIETEEIPPREYVFIVDVSGSMSGFPLDVSKEVMKNLLSQLRASDKFNIVFFAGGSSVYSETSISATESNIKQAITFLEKQRGGGGTELLNALKTSFNLKGTEDFSRTFVILTDGYVTVEREAFEMVGKNLGEANVFAFGIGSSVNRYIIEGLAHAGNGEPFVVTNEGEAKANADKFIEYIATPVLTNIKIDYSNIEVYDVLPSGIPDIFAERPVVIVGKFKGSAIGSVTLKGETGRGNYENTLDFKKQGNNAYLKALKYLWAREKIRELSDYAKVTYAQDMKKPIVEIGLKYNLLTEYTSFIAVDSEIINKGGEQTTVNQALPLPEGVSDLAVGYTATTGAPRYKAGRVKEKSSSGNYYFAADCEADELLVESTIEEEAEEDKIFYSVEKMPVFSYNGMNLQEYFAKYFTLPDDYNAAISEGKIIIEFEIDKDGSIINVILLRGIDKKLDEKILKFFKEMPKWSPGKQNGKPVKVKIAVPVKIDIQ